ncbi:MAG: DUF87 domain-containing protein [Planctomycetes bacterium]|nr:DUF87 domain-containing protein [Planctomycetota bacterium]
MAAVSYDRGVETIPPGTFPKDYAKGHFAVIGRTGSGKSYYAKYVVKNLIKVWKASEADPPVYLFVDIISAAQWEEPESDGRLLVPLENQYNEWNPDVITTLMEKITQPGHKIVIFDDFKGKVNFHTDKTFKNMFRTFRQQKAQVMAIGHSPNDIPPVVRDNVTHVIMAYVNNVETIKALATQYLMADARRLREALSAMNGEEYMMVKINVNRNTLAIHKAHDNTIHTTGSDLDIPIPGGFTGAVLAGGTSGASGQFGPNIQSTARGDVTVAGSGAVYNDHSTNQHYLKLQQDLDVQVRENHLTMMNTVARTDLQMQLEEKRLLHERRMSKIRELDECRTLLHQTTLTKDERARVSNVISRRLRRPGLTPHEIFLKGYDVDFMSTYFPGDSYTKRSSARGAMAAYGGAVESLMKGDTSNLMLEGANVALSTGLLGKMLDVFGISQKQSSSNTALTRRRSIAREEIRRRILAKEYANSDDQGALIRLLNFVRSKKNANHVNYPTISLEFLKHYYPSDYAQMVSGFKQNRLARRPSQTPPSPSLPTS